MAGISRMSRRRPDSLSYLAATQPKLWLDAGHNNSVRFTSATTTNSAIYASTPHASTLSPQGKNWWAFAWIYTGSKSNYGVVFSKASSATNFEYALLFDTGNANAKIYFQVIKDGTNNTTLTTIAQTDVFPLNTWVHVFVYHINATRTFGMLINGADHKTATYNSPDIPRSASQTFWLGYMGNGNTNSSTIDSMGIGNPTGTWNSTVAENVAKKIYNNNIGITYANLQPVHKSTWGVKHWWDFDNANTQYLYNVRSYDSHSQSNFDYTTNTLTSVFTSFGKTYKYPPQTIKTSKSTYTTPTLGKYYSIADNTSLQTGNVDFWYAIWCKPNGFTSHVGLCSKYNWGGSSEYYSKLLQTNGQAYVGTHVGGTAYAVNTSEAASTSAWNLVFFYNSTTDRKLYICLNNGSFYGSGQYPSGGIVGTANPVWIAKDQLSVANFDGLIGPVVFGKSPVGGINSLATTIRDALYNNGNGLDYTDLTSAQKTAWGLVSWWRLGGSELDMHGGNTLTFNGTTASDFREGKVAYPAANPALIAATWSDKSGNNFPVSQTTSSYAPAFTPGSLNGIPCFRLDGVNDRLTGTFTATVEGSWFLVMKRRWLTGNYNGVLAVSNGTNDYSTTASLSFHDGSNTVAQFFDQYRYTTNYREANVSLVRNNDAIVELQATLADVKARLNFGSFSTDSDSTSTFTNPIKISVGSRLIPHEASFANFDIYEIIFINKVITDTERNQILTYIVKKYLKDPSNVIATVSGDTAVITWQAVTFATSYNVNYKLSSSSTWTLWTNTAQLTSTITGLSADTSYDFQIQSVWSI